MLKKQKNYKKPFLIAEIGINHNGSLKIAKKMIDASIEAGADAVKFQKRDIDVVYSKEQLKKPRISPFGSTEREQKEGLEFSEKEFYYDLSLKNPDEFKITNEQLNDLFNDNNAAIFCKNKFELMNNGCINKRT